MAGHELVGFQTIALRTLWLNFLISQFKSVTFVTDSIPRKIPLTLPNTNTIVVGKMSESFEGKITSAELNYL